MDFLRSYSITNALLDSLTYPVIKIRMGEHTIHDFFDKYHTAMYCIFPHSNFDDYICSTDKRYIGNEIGT